MFNPADETSREGMQDTYKIKAVKNWFGMPPQSVQDTVGKGISKLHAGMYGERTDNPKRAKFRAGMTQKFKNGRSKKRSPTARDEEVKV